jgi:ParB family chromosome partitioning protein
MSKTKNFGGLINSNVVEQNVFVLKLDEVVVINKTDRSVFENADAKLQELANSIQENGQIHPITVRPIDNGKYELICGERRLKAFNLLGLTTIEAKVVEANDEQVLILRRDENIHTKNYEQFEYIAQIKSDYDELQNIEKVAVKWNKSPSFISKYLSLSDLPPETQRLVSDNVTADLEVVSMVKIIENIDPIKAKDVVDDLAKNKGKKDARKTAKDARDEVKPKREPKPKTVLPDHTDKSLTNDELHTRVAEFCFTKHKKKEPHLEFLANLKDDEREALGTELQKYHSKGAQGDIAYSFMAFNNGTFATTGFSAVRYASFLVGLSGLECDSTLILAYVLDYVSKSL